jgi:exopolysaccharide production protein ExoQ
MAVDGTWMETRSGARDRVAEAGFVLLLLLLFIGLTPFDDRNAAVVAARNAATASGDVVRQLAFIGVFTVAAFAAWRRHGMAAVKAMPPALALLLAWCLLSSLWAEEPGVVFRRAMLTTIFAASIMLSVDTLGAARALVLWRNVLAAIVIIDWASVALVHNAIHQADDFEAGLTGAWRGVHAHKNSAGGVMTIATMIFFYFALETKRLSDILLCLAAFVFLVMTRSKSSLGLLPVALAAGFAYRLAARSRLDRVIAATGALLATLALAVVIAVNWHLIGNLLDDPQHFTGRAAIWQAEGAFIRDHPLFGAGFGTFGNTGARSPLYAYAGGWLTQIGEGHNGYLETFVTVGGIGFALALIALVIQPFIAFWSERRTHANFNTMLFSIFAFIVLHNFMESDFIEVTAVQWGQMLLIVALLQASAGAEADRPAR